MPYEESTIPTENTPPLPVRDTDWTFRFSLDKATIDDLDLFSAENSTSNKQMLDFLDRVVTDVAVHGESQGAGVRGKGVPYTCLKRLMEGVGAAMKDANSPN
jgi:hypothetical protein